MMKDDIYYVVFTYVSSAYNDHHIITVQDDRAPLCVSVRQGGGGEAIDRAWHELEYGQGL